MTFPTCSSCDLAVREEKDLWCHAYPPTVRTKMVAITDDGPPRGQESVITYFPVVGEDKPGCLHHPAFMWPWQRWWHRRRISG